MNTKNLVAGGVAGTIFIFLYEWLVHGVLLMGMYDATASVWRPFEQMESLFMFSVAIQIALAFLMAGFIGKRHIHGAEAGACFGAMIGLFMAIAAMAQYVYLPLDLTIPMIWAVAVLVEMTILGALAGVCNRG